ncbi:hypothetical protein C0Q70_01661 [Pomacea canaliculata]|uniref:ADAMTS/ADAMTS-like Spacer 1 domain-containing protein n=1 Tax=Pomacea canaliculata TaxID=400727 RepID=A0A2T7Q040_POMCA|nr:hypothetical protein C0Q70_01661 [Pomacea canaliculata]
MEFAFPSVVDIKGRPFGNWTIDTPLPASARVMFTWRGRQRLLRLFHNDVAVKEMVVVYNDRNRNDTVAEIGTGDNCFHVGFVKGEPASLRCSLDMHGSGYIQTDEELLFVVPWGEDGKVWGQRPHVLYTCNERNESTANGNDNSMCLSPLSETAKRSWSTEGQLADEAQKESSGGQEEIPGGVGGGGPYDHSHAWQGQSEELHHDTHEHCKLRVSAPHAGAQHPGRRYGNRSPGQGRSKASTDQEGRLPHCPTVLSVVHAPLVANVRGQARRRHLADQGKPWAGSFGLFHDGHGNSCTGRRYTTAVMAPLVEAKLNHYWWSECSKQRMHEVINYLYCLNDEPNMVTGTTHYDLDSGSSLRDDIGKDYSLQFQCRLEFGHDFILCAAFEQDSCNMLWCSERKTPHMCRTKRGPPLPGSSCGHYRQCRNSQCIYVGNEKPVHGGWSDWEEWGSCSVDCGVGIRRRRRSCTKPQPAYGGKDCDGNAEDWDTCMNKDCSQYQDSREAHCAVWNDLNIRSGYHVWLPYQSSKGEEYESVVLLPKGCRNIEIVKRGINKHFVALRDPRYGTFPLNGDKRRGSSRDFIFGGARFVYKTVNFIESIKSSGPLYNELEVMLYPNKDNTDASVTYEYTVNRQDMTLEKRKYQWKFHNWTACSVTCGDGVMNIEHACFDKDSGLEVSKDSCQYLEPPRRNEVPCHAGSCTMTRYTWAMTNDWSLCNASECGGKGEETQGYKCELYYMNNDTYEQADMDLCDIQTAQ